MFSTANYPLNGHANMDAMHLMEAGIDSDLREQTLTDKVDSIAKENVELMEQLNQSEKQNATVAKRIGLLELGKRILELEMSYLESLTSRLINRRWNLEATDPTERPVEMDNPAKDKKQLEEGLKQSEQKRKELEERLKKLQEDYQLAEQGRQNLRNIVIEQAGWIREKELGNTLVSSLEHKALDAQFTRLEEREEILKEEHARLSFILAEYSSDFREIEQRLSSLKQKIKELQQHEGIFTEELSSLESLFKALEEREILTKKKKSDFEWQFRENNPSDNSFMRLKIDLERKTKVLGGTFENERESTLKESAQALNKEEADLVQREKALDESGKMISEEKKALNSIEKELHTIEQKISGTVKKK